MTRAKLRHVRIKKLAPPKVHLKPIRPVGKTLFRFDPKLRIRKLNLKRSLKAADRLPLRSRLAAFKTLSGRRVDVRLLHVTPPRAAPGQP